MMGSVSVDKKRLEDLERASRKLAALEAGGVDNWEWYSESLSDFLKEEGEEELISDFIGSLNDVIAEANVDQPAGPGCGYSITFNEGQVVSLLKQFLVDWSELQEDFK